MGLGLCCPGMVYGLGGLGTDWYWMEEREKQTEGERGEERASKQRDKEDSSSLAARIKTISRLEEEGVEETS